MTSRFGLFAKLSAKNLGHHRARWLLTICGIALGVTSFTGVVAMSSSIVASFERSITRTAGAAQLQVSNGTAGVDAAVLDAVRTVPGVESASGVVRYNVAIPKWSRRLTVFGVPLGTESHNEERFGSDALDVEDSLAFVAQVDSIAPAAVLARQLGIGVGSTLDVQGPKGPLTLVVRGELRPTDALRVLGDEIAVMDSDAAQNAFGTLDEFHWVDVVVRRGVPVDAVRRGIEAAVDGRAVVDTPLGRGRKMETMLGTLRTMLTLSGVVAMLVGVFLIYHTVATAVAHRRDELATLWTLGASRRHLFAHLLAEAVAVGLVGSLIGIALGLAFARVAAGAFGDVISSMYEAIPPSGVTVDVTEIAIALMFGLVAVIVGAIVPCAQALRLGGPKDRRPASHLLAVLGVAGIILGMRVAEHAGVGSFAGRIAAVGTFAALVFAGATLLVPSIVRLATPLMARALRGTWGVLGAWSWAQVRKRPGHTSVTMGALAAGSAFAIGMATLLGSYRHAFVGWIDQTFTADVFVNAGGRLSLLSGPTLDAAAVKELEAVSGVRQVLRWRLVNVDFSGQSIIVQGMDEALIDRAHAGVTLEHDAGEVVISDTLAERYRLSRGDELTIAAPRSPLTVKVGRVEPDYVIDLGNLKLGWRLFTRHFGEQGANVLLVDADAGVDAKQLKERLERRISGRYDALVLTRDELHETVNRLIDRSFALTHALEFLAALVTIAAMINATSAGIVYRDEELATLRALGMARRGIVRLLTVEAGLVGGLGSILGLAAGCVLGGTFVVTVARVVAGFRFPVAWPVTAMVSLTVLTTTCAAIAAFLVARRWTQHPITLETEAWASRA